LFNKKRFLKKLLYKLSCVCLSLKKLVNKKYFTVREKIVFLFIFNEKHFPEVVKNLEILYYLLIITNLVLKLLIAIYFVLIFFSISLLKIWFILIFILILVFIFMIVICFSLIVFLIEIFIYQIWSSIFFNCYLFYLK
jgi:hypothetical protein